MYTLGFTPESLMGLVTKNGFLANPNDTYNTSSPTFGNTAITLNCNQMPKDNDGKIIQNYTPDW